MRRTVLAFVAAIALVAGCSPPVEPPANADPAAAVGDATAPPEMPADAPPQEEVDPALLMAPVAAPASCLDDIGAPAAQRLVERCIFVSPATRPPCNVANPCALIQDEIDRSCDGYPAGAARPSECSA